jgi:hypothetical protein
MTLSSGISLRIAHVGAIQAAFRGKERFIDEIG